MLDSDDTSHSRIWQRSFAVFRTVFNNSEPSVFLAVAKTLSPRLRSCAVSSRPIPRDAPTMSQVELLFGLELFILIVLLV